MGTTRNCPRCNAPLGEQAPEGLCSRCLLEDLLAPDYAAKLEGPATSPQDAEVIRYFGDYEFLEQISRGGMGSVFKARQVSLNRLVAVKLIATGHSPSPTLRKRFQQEAEAAARLQHPHIIPIYEFGDYAGEAFLVMKLVERAQSLVDLRLPPRELVTRFLEIVRAVHYSHQHGVLHRDIKPSNILSGSDQLCYLTDFGLAKLLGSDAGLTAAQELLGTPAYMAPEQIRGGDLAATTAVDLYGLGATLYECLSGRPPFDANSIPELLRKIGDEEPAPLERFGVDQDLAVICHKCLEKDPAARYASAAALAEDLELWSLSKPIHARPVGNLERLGKWARRKPALAALAVTCCCALLTILVGISWFNLRLREKNREIVNRVIRLHTETGGRFAADGDPARAILYFAEALRFAEVNGRSNEVEMLRLRFDSLLRVVPSLLQTWFHPGGANDVQFSPDGARLVTAGNDHRARLWNVNTGAELITPLPHSAPVYKAGFSPDGRVLATVTEDAQARLWNASSGAPVTDALPLTAATVLWRFGPPPIGFSSDSQLFGYAGPDAVQILELPSGTSRRFQPASGPPKFFCFKPGSHDFAIATAAGVELWTTNGLAPHRPLRESEGIRWLGYSADGQRMIAIMSKGRLRVWDGLDHDLTSFDLDAGASSAVLRAGIVEGHDQVYAVNYLSTVRIWDLASRGLFRSFLVPKLADLVVSRKPDEFLTFSLDGSACELDSTGAQVGPRLWHPGAVAALAVHPSEPKMAAASQDGSVRLWSLPHHGLTPRDMDHSERPSVFATSQTGERRLSATGRVLRWQDGEREFVFHSPQLLQMAVLSKDGSAVAAIGRIPHVRSTFDLWAEEGRVHLQPPGGNEDGLNADCVRFHPNGLSVALALSEPKSHGIVRLIDARDGSTQLSGFRHAAPLAALDFSPDGQLLLTASVDATARVWDSHTGQPLSPPLLHDAAVSVASFSPDGSRFVTASCDDTFQPRCAQIWDARTFTPVTPRLWHQDGVLYAAFSPDGRVLATAGEDNLVFLWDAASGALLGPGLLQSHKADFVAFSSDSRLLLVSCRSSYLRVFHTATGEPVSNLIPHGASEAFAAFLPNSHVLSYTGVDGYPVEVPIQACLTPSAELRALGERLSTHTLSEKGLVRSGSSNP